MQWEPNRDFSQLPAVSPGDIVQLKASDGFGYAVKAIVSRVSTDQVEAVVEAVFDASWQGQVTFGKAADLVGSTLLFPPNLIHKVIRR